MQQNDSSKSGDSGALRHSDADIPHSIAGDDAGLELSNAKNAEVASKAAADWPDPPPLPEALLAMPGDDSG